MLKKITSSYVLPAIFLIGVGVVWELIVRTFNIPVYIFPPPSLVASAMVKYANSLSSHFCVTLYETLVGFAAGALTGVAIAICITYSNFLRNALYPLLILAQSVPKNALAPLALIWLGFGIESKVFLVILITFFPIVVNTAAGLIAVERELLYLINSLSATTWQIFRKIRFPNSLPYIFTGLKIAITLAVVGAVIAEFVGGNQGLGYLIVSASGELNTSLVFAAILLLAVMGIALFSAISFAERKLMPWHAPVELRVGGA
jgi:NitT/TauT family transport system permease protein